MIEKQQASLGTPWEAGANYSQGVKVGDTIYLAGQISRLAFPELMVEIKCIAKV